MLLSQTLLVGENFKEYIFRDILVRFWGQKFWESSVKTKKILEIVSKNVLQNF